MTGYADRGHHDCGSREVVDVRAMQAELPKGSRRGRSRKPKKRPSLFVGKCRTCGGVRLFAYKLREQLELTDVATPAPALPAPDQAQTELEDLVDARG